MYKKNNFLALITLSFFLTSLAHNLVEIIKINPNIQLDIRYATPNNFTGKAVYESPRCFLCKTTAQKINAIQKELETMGLGLKIWDGYRPRSVQYIFWNVAPDRTYVANPKKGSKHNRGTAVDCTLIDKHSNQLEMPSVFDEFSVKAHRNYASMTPAAAKNCKLLENLMIKYGFIPLPHEWWHFDDVDWRQYELLDIPFSQL
ncbi:M15 family metallopeptidase [bacterium]|nr:M15 family metallopeptidase [bacterium]